MKKREGAGNRETGKKNAEKKEKHRLAEDETIEECLKPWRELSEVEKTKHIEESAQSLASDEKKESTSIFDPLPGHWGPEKKKKAESKPQQKENTDKPEKGKSSKE